jgi:DNA topoisomerase IA
VRPKHLLLCGKTAINGMQDKKLVASNIEAQARYASILFIWTDCDREGEHIGTEIRDIALKANPNMQVYRARFSNIERACVFCLNSQRLPRMLT